MAAGVPVVASNRCGMPYLVRHGETGYLVDPSDPGDVARRIAQLLRDRELGQAMGRAAKDAARARFHPSAVARRTREVYLEAVANAGGPANLWRPSPASIVGAGA